LNITDVVSGEYLFSGSATTIPSISQSILETTNEENGVLIANYYNGDDEDLVWYISPSEKIALQERANAEWVQKLVRALHYMKNGNSEGITMEYLTSAADLAISAIARIDSARQVLNRNVDADQLRKNAQLIQRAEDAEISDGDAIQMMNSKRLQYDVAVAAAAGIRDRKTLFDYR
jgi:hypothetical protein